MLSADDELDVPDTLDISHCDDNIFLHMPNTIEDLEFDFPFSMDTDSLGGGLSALAEADHTGLVTC